MTKKKSQTVHIMDAAPRRSRAHVKKQTSERQPKHVVRSNIRARRTWMQRLVMHPTTTFAILVVGVLLIGLTYRVAASDYTVNAVVEAPALTFGAVITSPVDNATYNMRSITVSGDCPNESYIKLSRNSMYSGAAICNAGRFQIQTDLFVGLNDLRAQAYNITDQPGPVTPIVHVTYAPLAGTPDAESASPASGDSGHLTALPSGDHVSTAPLLLSSDYYFNVATTADVFEWKLQFHSGVAPYATRVDWGDGKISKMVVPSHDEFKISHRYTASGYYPIIVTGTDKNQRTVMLQLVAFIKKPGDPATRGSILAPPASPGGTPTATSKYEWLKYAWPTYGVISVMAISFWLGERREFLQLVKMTPKGHRRQHLFHP